MKEDKISQASFNLIQKELMTLTEKLEKTTISMKKMDDLELEIKGLKVFLSRLHPDFSKQFPDIMKKVVKK
jgi:hypothetical protein